MSRRIAYFVLGLYLIPFALFFFYGILHSREPGASIGWFFGYGVAFVNAVVFSVICFRKSFKKSIANE